MTHSNADFMKYLNFEKVKLIDMPIYDLSDSLRIYLKEFELLASFVGIEDMDICTVQLGKHMSPIIKNWLPTQTADIRKTWVTLKEQLLLQFGKPAEVEYREFTKNLRQ
ncbi:hypothetical protein BD408DRAFT_337351, partial [Parasitella parasitica]